GGASDIRLNGNTLSDRIVVAGGGGGAGGINYQALYGGAGGGLTGGDGLNWNTWPNAGGKGGTQTAGGAAGIACCSCPTYTTAGSLGQGGNGSGDCAGGGGGGGGYYGGGGACFSGGGGGSSYTDTIVYNVVHTQGYQNGDGMIILTYDPNAPIQTQDTTAACDSFFVQGAYQTSSGVYQDSLTSINGCDSIVAVALTINNSAFTSLSESSCDSFYVQGAYQTSSGLYYDTLQTLSGCDSIIETDLTVTNIDTAVTQNDTVLSANMAGATYQWVDCDSSYALMQGDTDQVYYPNANGNYAVIITLNGCTDTSGCHRVKTIGMSEITGSTSVFVYPNPATSSFTVEGNFSLPITLILYDLTGRQALEKELHGNRQQVDIRQLSKGMYLLQLSNAAGTTTRKLIIR
ncbi:MAG: T9SS type A sorting domain-containing protein, partial [Flavobacteriales bacterium]